MHAKLQQPKVWLQRPTLKTHAKFINSLRPYCCWERKLTPLLVKIITNFNKRLVATVDPAQQPLRLGRLIHNRAGRGSGRGSGFIRHKRSSQEPRMDSIVACWCSEVFSRGEATNFTNQPFFFCQVWNMKIILARSQSSISTESIFWCKKIVQVGSIQNV